MKCTPKSDLAPTTKKRACIIAAVGLMGSTLVVTTPSALADSAYAFGLNVVGQIGNGTTGDPTTTSGYTANSPSTPVPVLRDSSVTAVAGGGDHSLYVDNGALYAAGYGSYGQLGYGGTNQTNPTPLAAVNVSSGVTAVQGGYLFSLAIVNGGVDFFGASLRGEAGNGAPAGNLVTVPTPITTLSSGVTAIAAGQLNGSAIKNGGLYVWGDDAAGQVGNGATIDGMTVPPNVTTPYAVPGMRSGVTSIANGLQHTLAVMNGAAYAFGFNNYGQLGINGTTGMTVAAAYSTPQPVVGLPTGLPVSTVAAGNVSSMALVTGVAYAWGQNQFGQLGNGSTSGVIGVNQTPTAVTGITGFITDVQASTYSSYALGADGTLWSWGRNNYGQLGNGTTVDALTAQHILPPTGMVFTSLDAGAYSFHAVVTVGAAPSSWSPDASGNWNDSGNWTSGVPNSVDAPVSFTAPPITASRIITTTTPVTVGNLSFNSYNSPSSSYTIQGAGSITLQANLATSVRGAAINDYVGNHTVAPATLEFATNSNLNVTYGAVLTLGSATGNVLVDSNTSLTETGYGTVSFPSKVSLQTGASLSLNSPTTINSLTLAANASTAAIAHGYYADNLLTLGSLTLNATSKLDVTNNEAIVHTGDIAAITAALSTGFNSGTWNGSGIASSTAAADTTHLTAVGSLRAATAMNVSGQSLAAGDVLLKYTYYGDADLSGFVDASDYSRIDNGFLLKLTGWNNGDFNYDGVINGSDYTLIDNAFNTQGAAISSQIATPTAQIATATAAVPEPSTLTLLSIGATTLLGRRRRCR